jgi:hypothetical protein
MKTIISLPIEIQTPEKRLEKDEFGLYVNAENYGYCRSEYMKTAKRLIEYNNLSWWRKLFISRLDYFYNKHYI